MLTDAAKTTERNTVDDEENYSAINDKIYKFIDLFAGIGGIRLGFERAANEFGISSECVFTSEIKPHAVSVLNQNHPTEKTFGDITKIAMTEIPDFDFLLAGFPCQAFSAAGKRQGFADTRGTLFFEVERILREKIESGNPAKGFLLENVEGLVNHDGGKTLTVILAHLDSLDYKVNWKILNAKDFGLPQDRKRIYIVGTLNETPKLEFEKGDFVPLEKILQKGLPSSNSKFVKNLLAHYSVTELYGKSIKDKRGGNNNIHSWDLEIKGKVSAEQKKLLNRLLKERRKKKWADEIGIKWMDGMPLTKDQIATFFDTPDLQEMLDDLVEKRYLVFEFPKKLENGIRVPDTTKPKGYNIVTGKMSFEVNKVLNPAETTPTLVAMDMQHLFVPDGDGIRPLSLREGLRLFGYPEDFKFDVAQSDGYDLLGNTVCVPVIRAVSKELVKSALKKSEARNENKSERTLQQVSA